MGRRCTHFIRFKVRVASLIYVIGMTQLLLFFLPYINFFHSFYLVCNKMCHLCDQGLIEPPKVVRGHVTDVDGEILNVTENTLRDARLQNGTFARAAHNTSRTCMQANAIDVYARLQVHPRGQSIASVLWSVSFRSPWLPHPQLLIPLILSLSPTMSLVSLLGMHSTYHVLLSRK